MPGGGVPVVGYGVRNPPNTTKNYPPLLNQGGAWNLTFFFDKFFFIRIILNVCKKNVIKIGANHVFALILIRKKFAYFSDDSKK